MALSDAAIERYARHLVLREIGGPGQARLRRARVLVIGAGGLGSPALLYLAAAGVGTIGLVDDDVVSLSNLQRQVLHRTADIGAPKVDSAARALEALNPDVELAAFPERLTETNADALIEGWDLVVDGSDNFATRRLANQACVRAGAPLVFGAIGQWEGQVSVFHPAAGGPCYHCVFPEDPAPGLAPSCAEGGVLGALAGVVGALMASEAVKTIVGAGDTLRGRLWLFDALYGETRTIALDRRPDCPICGAIKAR